MNNQFHIKPDDVLADQAADEVADYPRDTLVAVVGDYFNDEPVFYTVSACPDQENTHRYSWTYVRAGEWLDAYKRASGQ